MPVPPATFRPAYGRCYLLFLLPCLVGILLAAVVDPYTSNLPMPVHVWVGGEIAAMVGAAVGILVKRHGCRTV